MSKPIFDKEGKLVAVSAEPTKAKKPAATNKNDAKLATEAAKILREKLEAAKQGGYQEGEAAGRKKGYQEGCASGKESGKKEGAKQGREEGIREGYEDGLHDGALRVTHRFVATIEQKLAEHDGYSSVERWRLEKTIPAWWIAVLISLWEPMERRKDIEDEEKVKPGILELEVDKQY